MLIVTWDDPEEMGAAGTREEENKKKDFLTVHHLRKNFALILHVITITLTLMFQELKETSCPFQDKPFERKQLP